MKSLVILVMTSVAFSVASAAQSGPVAQQSSDELICQLIGECATEAVYLGHKTKRGFDVIRPGQKPSSSAAAASPLPSRSAPARIRPAVMASSGNYASHHVAMAKPGRADLMITFVTGNSELTEQARINAGQFVRALSSPKLAGMRFAIEGHTDAVGDRAYNLDLSRRRAQAVVDFLASKGVDKSRFTVNGYGFDRPIDPRHPMSGVNRRVEVVKVS